GRIRRGNEASTQPENSASARLLVMNQLEVIRLRLAFDDGFQHRAQLLVPGAATKLVDPRSDTLLGCQSKHGVKALVGCPNLELGVKNKQRFAARSFGADHYGCDWERIGGNRP